MRATSASGWAVVLVCGGLCSARQGRAQEPTDTTRCDSIVAATRVDSAPAGLLISVTRMDGPDLSPQARDKILSTLVASFVPPKPFRLTVFAGGARMRALRPHDADRADARTPVVTGRYRVYSRRGGDSLRLALVRESLMPGFDEAAEEAVRSVRGTGAFAPPPGADSMIVDVRFSSDSSPGARRFVEAFFPRMPVVDALPALDNPPPDFPEDERADSVTAGEVVFQLVIDRSGSPAMQTVEVLRASSMSFLRAALRALPGQRFTSATIRGCRVAQQIEYPIVFILHAPAPERASEPASARRRGGIDAGATAGP